MGDVTSARPGLHASLLDRLGLLITSGDAAAGSVLRADDLEARFGVSRTVVREAVRVLEALGLVRSRRRVGAVVEPERCWNVFDPTVIRWRLAGPGRDAQLRTLTELRAGFEPAAAALAAQRATPEQCGVLTGAVVDMSVHGRSGDLEAYLAADVTFHSTLLAATGNEMLAALAGVVEEVLAGRTHHGLMPARPEPVAIRLHGDVAQAVQAGDAAAARAAMEAILAGAAGALPGVATPAPRPRA
jgi:DNA-binding FadR family transcriptional regulator